MQVSQKVSITECPRDAMQGIHSFIPTSLKADYLNALLECGFEVLDFGSFVSPKAVPQLADTAEVLERLKPSETKLLAIVANRQGAEAALEYDQISILGYPFSISESFQQRNTKRGMQDSLVLVEEMLMHCETKNKNLLVYLSMAFGNPYGDPWSKNYVADWAGELVSLGVKDIALADTIGSSHPENIESIFKTLLSQFPDIAWGAHFHSTPENRQEKIEAAWNAGCRKFDVAIHGFGGCPFAKDELTGNLSTQSLLAFLEEKKVNTGIHAENFKKAIHLANQVFAFV